jgi:hypothetical protein
LEGRDDIAVFDLAPADDLLEVRGEDAEDLAVDVVDGRRGEKKGADRPAKMAWSFADFVWTSDHEPVPFHHTH